MSEVTHFIYRIQPTRPAMLTDGPSPEEQTILSAHFEYLTQLRDQGVVVLAGRTLNTDESSFGIAILRVSSEAAARDVMRNDPAVKHNVMRAELFPYRIALMAKGS
jgi:uncharacterized protein YciI